jgi:hypothetical protein
MEPPRQVGIELIVVNFWSLKKVHNIHHVKQHRQVETPSEWPQWTSTHQCTNVDGWCTDGCTFFVTPCHWANQGGQLKLTFVFFFFPSSAQVGLFFCKLFFLTPHTCPRLTYLHIDYLPMHPGLLPPPPTYLPAHLPTHLPTFPITDLLIN